MRPLLRPTIPTERLSSRTAYALLLNVFGPYCALSEEPLYDVASVWDKGSNAEFNATQPPLKRWDDLLLLSPGVCDAWRRHHDVDVANLMLPDQEKTFQLEDSPFVYQLEKVNRVVLDEDDKISPESGTEEIVIVRGTNPRAEATIETFSLNSEYFNPETRELRIPREDHCSCQDALLRNRTLAWQRASVAAEQIAGLSSTDRRVLLAQLQMSAAVTGHWSVWATVLWSRLKDGAFIGQVLGGQTQDQTDRDLIGFGPHNEFPGTSPGSLLLAARRIAATG